MLSGQHPGERYHAAREPPYNRDDHKLDDPARGIFYKRLQVNPFEEVRRQREKRARTFWREPQNDLIDSVIDLGRGAVDWTHRQFE